MEGIGGILRDARERKGVTYEDIEGATKIKKRYIQALELEEWGLMPGRVYAKGFLRTYARYLSLDEQSLCDLFEVSLAAKEPSKPSTLYQVDDKAKRGKTARKRHGVDLHNKPKKAMIYVLCVMSVAIFAFCIWAYQTYHLDDLEADKINTPPIVFPLPEPPPVVAVVPDLKPLPIAYTSIHLKIAATQPCWLRVADKDALVYEGTLIPGDTQEFSELQTIEIRLGNAGGVVLTVNDLELPMFGSSGQVVTKYFSINDGIVYDDETGEAIT